ncbi:hypothetical protein AC579_7509 [Pseudocercospora musae]|uniref:Uncharacterized protein n=1 Tax=Pseudocercospora musae TaxID=113226 RepID=A0A139IBT4_9PEZI|nr:hypothetical protein AC579_7509 [Pseudocercospora musae]
MHETIKACPETPSSIIAVQLLNISPLLFSLSHTNIPVDLKRSEDSMLCKRLQPKMDGPRTSFAIKCDQAKQQNPLRQGALASKDDIRAIQGPGAEYLPGNDYKAIEELPECHPNQIYLQELLRNEPRTPFRTSTRTSSNKPSSNTRSRRTTLLDLSFELRKLIYEYSVSKDDPISPVFKVAEEEIGGSDQFEVSHLEAGLPGSIGIFPGLEKELVAMLPTFYRANTFQFDLRGESAGETLQRWINEKSDEASGARKICLKHWTWYYNASAGWEHVPDETILSITSSGHVRVTRIARQLHPLACTCEMDDFVSAQCPDWKINKLWSVADFVSALRQEEGLLIQAVNKLMELIHYHNETFHMWRQGPKSCKLCGKKMIFIRSFDEVEWTSD